MISFFFISGSEVITRGLICRPNLISFANRPINIRIFAAYLLLDAAIKMATSGRNKH